MRDIVLRGVPAIFGGSTLYATSTILASGVMVALFDVRRARSRRSAQTRDEGPHTIRRRSETRESP